jgi:serine/threonine-protein kinase
MAGAAWLDPKIANKVLRAQTAEKKEESSQSLSSSKIKLLSLVEAGKNVGAIAKELNVDDSLVKELLNELLDQLKGSGAQEVPSPGADKKTAFSNTGFRLAVGDVIAQHYKIEGLLGEGGMGCVYKAKHTFIDRTVAIKTLHPHVANQPDTLARFKIEAESSAAAVHPHLVTIFDFGLWQDSVPYIVMEYLEGVSLQDLIDQHQRLDEKTVREIFVQVCEALEAVHEKGIVHRDLKPANVMLLSRDGKHFVKVVDFGIAKILEGGKHNLTKTGEAMGTPYYMSPEQCMGSGHAKIDHRSDLYSLGCMMFEALTGEPIFVGSTFLEIVMCHVRETPSMDLLKDHKVSSGLIDTVSKLTRKGADERPANAAAVKEMLSTVKKGIFS